LTHLQGVGEPDPALFPARCFLIPWALAVLLGGRLVGAPAATLGSGTNAASVGRWYGPAFSEFGLTLQPGSATEGIGPLLATREVDGEHLVRFSPFFVSVKEPALEKVEVNVLYPAIAYRRYGTEWKMHFFQFFEFAGGNTVDDETKKRTTVFPFYFRQKSTVPTNDYIAVLPFYGHLKNRLFRSEVKFILAPLYVQSTKRDWVTDNYLMPFFHRRHGPHVDGWQFWPLVGAEHRRVSWVTNSLDELEVVPGHDKRFLLWPFGFSDHLEVGGANPTTNFFMFPWYLKTRSVEQDHDWIAFFSHRTNRVAKFEEWSYPWPFFGRARGPGKTADRYWPVWGHAEGGAQTSDFALWPLYTHKRLHADPLDRERHRFLYFAYDDLRQSDTSTGRSFRRRSLWPFFLWRHEPDGRERLQVLAPLEPLVSGNVNVERLYSPLWSVWRSESNPATHRTSQSLLWNLWQREQNQDGSRAALFFGALQTEANARGRRWSFFGLGRGKDHPPMQTARTTVRTDSPFAHRGPEWRAIRRPDETVAVADAPAN